MGIEIRLGFLLELWIRLDHMSKVTGLNTLLAFVVVKEKYSAVGGTKWHPTTKERGDIKMWVLRKHPLTSLWCFFMEYCWVICQIHHRGVWTDCLLLLLLFSQQAATEPFVFHQSLILSLIPFPPHSCIVFATSFPPLTLSLYFKCDFWKAFYGNLKLLTLGDYKPRDNVNLGYCCMFQSSFLCIRGLLFFSIFKISHCSWFVCICMSISVFIVNTLNATSII